MFSKQVKNTLSFQSDGMPCFVRYTEAARHDHVLLLDVSLSSDSILCFDKGYVDYQRYEVFTTKRIWYITRLKDNAQYECKEEYDIPDDVHDGVLMDEEIILTCRPTTYVRFTKRDRR